MRLVQDNLGNEENEHRTSSGPAYMFGFEDSLYEEESSYHDANGVPADEFGATVA